MSDALKNKPVFPMTIALNLNPENGAHATFHFNGTDLKIYNGEEQLRCDLSQHECLVLGMLISAPDKIFSKTELIEFAWARRVVSEGSLTHAIFSLRSFFWRCGKDVIITVPRAGYYFNSKFLIEANPLAASTTPLKVVDRISEQLPFSPHTPQSARSRKALIGLVASILLGGGSFLLLFSEGANFLINEPITIEKIKVGEATVNLVGNTHINPSLQTQRDNLIKQLNNISLNVTGEAWLSYTKARYRVTCYTSKNAVTYAAPMTVNIEEVLKTCLSI